MKKWIIRIISFLTLGAIGAGVYDTYRGGFFSLPDIPNGHYPISFKNGFRAIVTNIEVSDASQASTPEII